MSEGNEKVEAEQCIDDINASKEALFFAHLSIDEDVSNKTALRVIIAQACYGSKMYLLLVEDRTIQLNLTSYETVQRTIEDALPSGVKACVFKSEGAIDGLIGDMIIKALEAISEGAGTLCSRILYTDWGLKALADVAVDCQDLRINPDSFEVRPHLVPLNEAVQKLKSREDLRAEDLEDVRSILALFRKAKECSPNK